MAHSGIMMVLFFTKLRAYYCTPQYVLLADYTPAGAPAGMPGAHW